MPQGKFKGSKAQVPGKKKGNKAKQGPHTQRKNRPIQPKKAKIDESSKIKKIISKNVNKTIEDELRVVANSCTVNLSKKKNKEQESKQNKMPPPKQPASAS